MAAKEKTGRFAKIFLFLLIGILLLTGVGYAVRSQLQSVGQEDSPELVSVRKDLFTHEILERGSVESASNIDIRCQVESAGGLTIISVVPEGTIVKKGDLLVELDSSTLRENVTTQQIAVLASKAKLAQSKANLKTAELTLLEYVKGKFEEEKKLIENEMFSAEESVKTKEGNLQYYKRLLERGYVTDSKVKADLIDLEKLKQDYEIAVLKMEVLLLYTRQKNIVQYEANIATAKTQVESDEKSLELDEERLRFLETQRDLCKIYAPQAGQVVYYTRRRGGEEDLIEEGKKVWERQILIRLPDPAQMQVKGLVNEANIRLVQEGQPATVRLEAFPNRVFKGVVRQVNAYPEPSPWMGTTMSKEYETTISILDPPEGIKPGLTAEAKIKVNTIADALVLPAQAIFSHGSKAFAVTYDKGNWGKTEVQIGPTNDKEVVVLAGLNERDKVVLGAWAHRDKIELPSLTPAEEQAQREKEAELAQPPQDREPPTESEPRDMERQELGQMAEKTAPTESTSPATLESPTVQPPTPPVVQTAEHVQKVELPKTELPKEDASTLTQM